MKRFPAILADSIALLLLALVLLALVNLGDALAENYQIFRSLAH